MHRVTALVTAASIALGAAAPAHAEDEALRKELEALRQQVAALQAEVAEMRTAKATPVAAAPSVATPVVAPAPAAAPAPVAVAPALMIGLLVSSSVVWNNSVSGAL